MSNSEQRQRTGRLPAIRCYKEEEKIVRDRAEESILSVGQFMLAAALGRPTRSKQMQKVVNELRRLGGLQKHLFNESNGGHSKEYSEILVAIKRAIERIGN